MKHFIAVISLLSALFLTSCTIKEQPVGVLYNKMTENRYSSLKVLFGDDKDSIRQIIITNTVDTELMKKQAKTDDFDLAKNLLVLDYQEKQKKIANYHPYATVCDICKLDEQTTSVFLSVRLSDTINQVNDQRFQNSQYFNYVEQYKLDFLVDDLDWHDPLIVEILSEFGLKNSIDEKTETIRYSLLKEDKASPLYVFFEIGEQAEIMKDGSFKKLTDNEQRR